MKRKRRFSCLPCSFLEHSLRAKRACVVSRCRDLIHAVGGCLCGRETLQVPVPLTLNLHCCGENVRVVACFQEDFSLGRVRLQGATATGCHKVAGFRRYGSNRRLVERAWKEKKRDIGVDHLSLTYSMAAASLLGEVGAHLTNNLEP